MLDQEARLQRVEKSVATLNKRLDAILLMYCKSAHLEPEAPDVKNARVLDKVATDIERLNQKELRKNARDNTRRGSKDNKRRP